MPDNTPATKADLEALHQALKTEIIEAIQALQSSVTMRRSLLFAPLDDEPYTEEQQRQDAQSIEAIDRGEWVSHEDVCKEFGL
jgi:hypothetical protein